MLTIVPTDTNEENEMQIDIQSRRFALTGALKRRIKQRLSFALDIKNAHIQRIKVRLSDINGPRGGEDKCCHIQIELPNSPDVVIKEVKSDLNTAIDRASHRAAYSVVRKLSRMRDKGRLMKSSQTKPWMALPEPGYQ
jgi:putative sigma-54 modulation protein